MFLLLIPPSFAHTAPSQAPSHSPVEQPSRSPSNPSFAPSFSPIHTPTNAPSNAPSNNPSLQPLPYPSQSPTNSPSEFDGICCKLKHTVPPKNETYICDESGRQASAKDCLTIGIAAHKSCEWSAPCQNAGSSCRQGYETCTSDTDCCSFNCNEIRAFCIPAPSSGEFSFLSPPFQLHLFFSFVCV